MRPLRLGSWRPELIVDDHAFRLWDPVDQTYVGVPGPFGRERVVFALPFNGGGTPSGPLRSWVVHDNDGFHLADPDGNLVGRADVWIPRLLDARWTEDTRRLR